MPSSHQSNTTLPSIHELLPDHLFHRIPEQPEQRHFPPPPRYPAHSSSSMSSPNLSPSTSSDDRHRFQVHAGDNVPSYTYPPPPAPGKSLRHQSEYTLRSPHMYGRASEDRRSAGHPPHFARHGPSLSVPDGRYDHHEESRNIVEARNRSRSSPTPRVRPVGSPYSSASPISPSDSLSESDELEDDDDPMSNPSSQRAPTSGRPGDVVEDPGRRHECPHCHRRFNRPSSLGIHINTHTGARPFICTFPGCGKAFNVNSNMRRHYRKHMSPSDVSGQHLPAYPPSSSSPNGSADLQIIRYHESTVEPIAFKGIRGQRQPRVGIDTKDAGARSYSWETSIVGRDHGKMHGSAPG